MKPTHLCIRRNTYEVLTRRFSDDDLQDLCYGLGLDWDDLAGDTHRAKARAIIQHFERRKQMQTLRQEIRRRRPDVAQHGIKQRRGAAYPTCALMVLPIYACQPSDLSGSHCQQNVIQGSLIGDQV